MDTPDAPCQYLHMNATLEALVATCTSVANEPDAQAKVQALVSAAVTDPAVAAAIRELHDFSSLEDLAIHRSEHLTMLAGALPPGFRATPHNHNIWSVVGVCGGQEDNQFFEREGSGLKLVSEASVVAPGVLPNDPEVIHAIANPLDESLLALHAYGGDLFATPRSNWDPETHEEIAFDWEKVKSTES